MDNLTQLKTDITDFVVLNKEPILDFLNSMQYTLSKHKATFELLDIYKDAIFTSKKHHLTHYIAQHFVCDIESLLLIIDDDFVKITLYN